MTALAMSIVVMTVVPTQSPTISAFAGTGEKGYSGDGGPAAKAKLDNPFDVAFDKAGNLFFSDMNNHCIRRVHVKTDIITTVAGNGKKGYSGDGGPATKAELNEPYGIEVDRDGAIFVVDRLNACVRKIDASGVITTLAGNGKPGYGGDGGPVAKAQLREPNGLCLDNKGQLYIADVRDQRVRVVDLKSGTITTFCGNGQKATAGDDGPIAKASLNGPRAVAALGQSILIVEREGNCVRKVDPARDTVTRFVGTGKKGYTGDGGPALQATFDGPKEIDVDRDGNVFVVDTENEAIRRIDAKTGIVTTVAGKGRTKTPGMGDGGPATAATLGRPHGVAISQDGHIFIGDTLAHRIRVVR